MDLATLSTLAEQLAPLVLQKIKGKGKKEVSELTTVNDYENVKSLPAWYWNKQTGEKKAVNVSMADFQQHIQDVANQNLTDIKQEAEEANAAAQNSAESAAASAASAKASEDAALAQKNETVDYLNTVKANENERIASENARISAENARKEAETLRASQENSRINAEADRVEEEAARVSAETLRAQAEIARVNAESARAKAETDRQSAWSAWFENATTGVKALWNTWFDNIKSLWETLESDVNNATTLAVEAAENANNSANHPPYVGEDLYWYVWNNSTKSYDKTDKYSKGDGFSIKKTFASISEMEAYDNSSVILELGDFVLISSNVEDEDNSKLYVVQSVTSTKISYGFLTDMSGARGFTGHTPQLSVGTITTGAAGTLANVSLTENGTDANGNPKYLINFVIPKGDKGDKGDPFTYNDFTSEQIATLQAPAVEAATKANTAAANSDKQTLLCKSATDLAEELNAHPQMQGENGNWWKWNTETNEYEDTGIIARGGGMYPMVRSRRNHVIWYDSTDGFKERIVRRRNHTIIKL